MSTDQDVNAPKPVWNFADYTQFFPSYGWIRDYFGYAIQCTDAPPLYHLMASIGILSVALDDRIDLFNHNEPTPLHLYLLIIGESGTRKSAALKRAIRTVQPIFNAFGKTQRLWHPESCSVEGILEALGTDPNRLMILSEWTELHRQTNSTYWKGASEFFNIAYDGMPMTRNRAKLVTYIQRPRLSILGASTASLIGQATTSHDWSAGKMARYLMLYESKPQDKVMDAAIDLPVWVNDLQVGFERFFCDATSHMIMTPIAWKVFRNWKNGKDRAEIQQRFSAEHLEPALNRMDEHILRIAAIYQASMTFPHSGMVEEEAMTKAIAFVEYCTLSLLKIFPTLPGYELHPIIRLKNIITAAGPEGIKKRDVLRQIPMGLVDFDRCIAALLEREEVQVAKLGKSVRYNIKHDLKT
jgi:hypothetical protein